MYNSIMDFKVKGTYPEPDEGPALTKKARFNVRRRDEHYVLEGMYCVTLSISIRSEICN